MSNPFVHIELSTTDIDRARKFYGELFQWKLVDVPMGEMMYTMIQVGEGVGGGMMPSPDKSAPSRWLCFVDVSDVAAGLERAKSLGATVVQEKTPIPGNGFFGVIVDPTGAALGLVEHN